MRQVLERTLSQMAKPDMPQQPLCIVYSQTIVSFELKPRLIHLLPRFRGSVEEDPLKQLKEFHIVCDEMRPYSVTKG